MDRIMNRSIQLRVATLTVIILLAFASASSAYMYPSRIDAWIDCGGSWDQFITEHPYYPQYGDYPLSCSADNTSGALVIGMHAWGFRDTVTYTSSAGTHCFEATTLFEVGYESRYEASGWLTASNPDNDSGWVDLRMALQEGDGPILEYDLPGEISPLFDSMQASDHTVNESFVIGGMEGDYNNAMRGDLSGTLFPYIEYTFYRYVCIGDRWYSSESVEVEAFGQVELSIIPLPEPSQAAMLASCGALLSWMNHRRTRDRR